jgi:hypothetical protein
MFMTGTNVGIIFDDAASFYLGPADPLQNNITMAPDIGISIGSAINTDVGITSRRNMTLEASDSNSIELRCVSTILTGDLNVQTINGLPPGSGGTTVSTYTQLFTSSIVMNGGYFSTLNGVGATPVIQGDSLEIVSGSFFMLTAGDGVDLTTLSNDIVLRPGFLTPGEISFRGITNFSNHPLTNVSTINGLPYYTPGSGSNWVSTAQTQLNMNNFNIIGLNRLTGNDITLSSLAHTYINAVADIEITTNAGLTVDVTNDIDISGANNVSITGVARYDLATAGAMTLTANTITLQANTNLSNFNLSNINNLETSTILVSTINTFPYHKAFGMAWATTTTTMVGGVPVAVDWGGYNYFNLSDLLGNSVELLPGIQPRNRGVYHVNARATFSNSDSVAATVSAYFNIDGYDNDNSRVSIDIEPSKVGSAIISWIGYIGSGINLTVYSDNSNITMFQYGAGSPYPPYRAFCANITLHQLYSYEGGIFPPNPLVVPPAT